MRPERERPSEAREGEAKRLLQCRLQLSRMEVFILLPTSQSFATTHVCLVFPYSYLFTVMPPTLPCYASQHRTQVRVATLVPAVTRGELAEAQGTWIKVSRRDSQSLSFRC